MKLFFPDHNHESELSHSTAGSRVKGQLLLSFSFLCIFGVVRLGAQEVSMSPIFSDNMVMQAGAQVPVWGWSAPGDTVTVSIAGQFHKTVATKTGDWRVDLLPVSHKGPYEMVVSGKSKLHFKNVLFGEVWLCGGQSNMQYTLDWINYEEGDPDMANNPDLRFFQVEIDLDYFPKKMVKGGPWKQFTNETIPGLSAVAYFFAQHLNKNRNCPVGLISSNLGATSIETWMSNGALKEFPQFEELIKPVEKSGKNFEALMTDLAKFRTEWDTAYYLRGPGIDEHWENPELDDSDWIETEVPMFWEYLGFEDHNGAGWFRRHFDKPENVQGDQFSIALNQIDDYDVAWLNGVKIGESFGNRNWRNYTFPADLLKEKDNVLAVRVFDIGGLGGIYTSAFWGNPILNGKWKFKPGLSIDTTSFPTPRVPNGSFFTHPAMLYNGNIAPLIPYRIKGAIWYQGESNEHRGEEYAELLPAMIKDWRKQWGQGDFPFLIVQLANYRAQDSLPGPSNWAEIREAQFDATKVKKVGVASAIDIGDANDIHPVNKMDVGERLGLLARKIAYQEDIIARGPVFETIKIEDNWIEISFDTFGSELVNSGEDKFLTGFAIAGKDRKFYWAKAEIADGKVRVWSDKVPDPEAVRYAWSDNPGQLELYNSEGLPAYPFRTDKWDLSSKDRVFTYDEHGF